MRIVTLIENLAYQRGLIAEHGLAFLIETGCMKILFDTGQSSNFIHNAKKLGIDLSLVDAVVISHGHYDHTGGLYDFLQINKRARVYIKKEAFYPKYHGFDRFIGVNYDPILDNRIEYVEESIRLDDHVHIMPDIPIKDPSDTHFHHFKIKTPDGFMNDEFTDELYLAITGNDALSIISSCSHRGIINIVDAAIAKFNLPVHTITGGFHIRNSGPERVSALINYFEKIAPQAIGICHCSGVEKYGILAAHFNESVFYNHTGFELQLNIE